MLLFSEFLLEEVEIANDEIYLANMAKSFGDKAWFLKYIPDSVTTIVDFGGGAGEFAEYCQKMLKRPMQFVIIDNNSSFLSSAEKKGFKCFTSLEELQHSEVDTHSALLVLSSVIHEIYSYRDAFYDDVGTFWSNIKRCRFKAIAIRDMSVGGNAFTTVPKEAALWVYQNVFKSDKIHFKGHTLASITDSFEEVWGAICDVEIGKVDVHRLVHFLIKYRYQENWDREVQENYLPVSQDKLQDWVVNFMGFTLVHKESSHLDFYDKCWAKDFKLNIPDNNGYRKEFLAWLKSLKTHIKWLGVR